MKTPMSSDTKLTKDKELSAFVPASKRLPKPHLEAVKRIFRYIKGTTHLGLWYPKGTSIETVVYADSDHAVDYVDRKSTSGNHAFQYEVSYSDEGQMFIEFVIQNQFFSYPHEEFALILDVPCEGVCVFTDRCRLDELAYGIPSDGPYQTNLPSIEDIISSIRINQDGQVRRICHEVEIDVLEYQVLTSEIEPTMKPLEEIIWENVFCLRGNRDHVPSCLCYILYYVVHSERFNRAYFMTKRMEWVTKQKRLILPYGMLLTRLFKFIVRENPELENESYVLYDRVMIPLAAQLEPRRDRGTRRGRHSTL
ncbi:hypothetical protein Tco_0684696 [Tanacetum coccineum]